MKTIVGAMVGRWIFIAGLVLAVLAGLFIDAAFMGWLLLVLGLIVGFLNIGDDESTGFLVAAIALILTGQAIANFPGIGDTLVGIFEKVVIFVSGAAIVVSIKALFDTAKS